MLKTKLQTKGANQSGTNYCTCWNEGYKGTCDKVSVGSESATTSSATDVEQVNNIEDIMKPSGPVPDGFFDVVMVRPSP